MAKLLKFLFITLESEEGVSPKGPLRQKTYLQTCASNDDSDQPVYSCSLIKIFTGRIWDSQG